MENLEMKLNPHLDEFENATIDYLRELYKLKASDNIVERLIHQVPASYTIELTVDPHLDREKEALLIVKHETFSFSQSVKVGQGTVSISTSVEKLEVPLSNAQNTLTLNFPKDSEGSFKQAYEEEVKELFKLALSYIAIESQEIKGVTTYESFYSWQSASKRY